MFFFEPFEYGCTVFQEPIYPITQPNDRAAVNSRIFGCAIIDFSDQFER